MIPSPRPGFGNVVDREFSNRAPPSSVCTVAFWSPNALISALQWHGCLARRAVRSGTAYVGNLQGGGAASLGWSVGLARGIPLIPSASSRAVRADG